jgi:hypothetical protein
MRAKTAKSKYHLRNWSEYKAALDQHGSLTLGVNKEVLSAWHDDERAARHGPTHLYGRGDLIYGVAVGSLRVDVASHKENPSFTACTLSLQTAFQRQVVSRLLGHMCEFYPLLQLGHLLLWRVVEDVGAYDRYLTTGGPSHGDHDASNSWAKFYTFTLSS